MRNFDQNPNISAQAHKQRIDDIFDTLINLKLSRIFPFIVVKVVMRNFDQNPNISAQAHKQRIDDIFDTLINLKLSRIFPFIVV